MATDFMLGKTTLSDIDSVEYEWIRTLHSNAESRESILRCIQTCLGGDTHTAELFYDIAIHKKPHNLLLSYLEQS